jgi:hypothetical protein
MTAGTGLGAISLPRFKKPKIEKGRKCAVWSPVKPNIKIIIEYGFCFVPTGDVQLEGDP